MHTEKLNKNATPTTRKFDRYEKMKKYKIQHEFNKHVSEYDEERN